jgi:hypothetical protein
MEPEAGCNGGNSALTPTVDAAPNVTRFCIDLMVIITVDHGKKLQKRPRSKGRKDESQDSQLGFTVIHKF